MRPDAFRRFERRSVTRPRLRSLAGSRRGLSSRCPPHGPRPGDGWSSPIILGKRVFLTSTTEGGKSCHILGLDAETGVQIMTVLEKLHRDQGQTIVMVTHDRALARTADRVLVLKEGKIQRAEEG